MHDFWPSSGFHQLRRDARGWLTPTDDYLRLVLARPELALVAESCPAETALHAALLAAPSRPIDPAALATLADEDARANYRMFIAFRDALLAAGTLEACYLGLMRGAAIQIPPLFIDLMVQAMVRNLSDGTTDPFEVRAGEMLFRAQRIAMRDGQVLAGDRDVLDLLNETGGLGAVGRLLVQGQAPVATVNLELLGDESAPRYWSADARFNFLLDLTHEVSQDLGHGLSFTMARARSGLLGLARVLEKWVRHFLGMTVRIRPLQKIDDAAWRWHLGLDVESSALLNDLYQGRPVEPARLQRMVSLFRLDFADPTDMRADVAGKPVYLGLAMTAGQVVKLKPQNLLLNLPLAAPM